MFRRPEERKELLFHVQRGNSILMEGVRRVGKTWLIKQFAEDLRADGWTAILCDVEGMSQEADFLRHLCQQIEQQELLMDRVKGRGAQLLNQLFSKDMSKGWQEALGQMDWSSFAETLVRGLDAREQKTVILVDELALFVMERVKVDATAARNFLYGLRALQQRYKKVQWLFTGSIGLDIIAKREGIGGALVDLKLFPLEPFTREAARAFLEHLAVTGELFRPFTLDEPAFTAFVEQLGWLSPYYLQHVAQEMRPTGAAGAGGRRAATVADVHAAFDAMLAPERRTYFVTWEEHLSKNFPTQEAAEMRRLLDECSREAGGEQFDTLFARLVTASPGLERRALRDRLSVLVTDGYLSEISGTEVPRFAFRSGLLRRYWQRYHAA